MSNTIFYLSMHPLLSTWIAFFFGNCKQCCYVYLFLFIFLLFSTYRSNIHLNQFKHDITEIHLKGKSLFLYTWKRRERKKKSLVVQSFLTVCDPMGCSLPGSSVHGIFQARVLEWVAISFSRGSSPPRDRTWVSHIVGRHFPSWREPVLTVSH